MGKTGKPGHVKPPKGLNRAGRELWVAIQREYYVEDAGGRAHLKTAATCADLEAEAMTIARADGLVVTDKYGQKRPHPMLSVARDARGQKLMALRGLNLDIQPLNDRPGRPGGR